MKKVEKLQQMPYTGKPLEYRLAPYRSVRVKGKYRLDVSTRGVIWKIAYTKKRFAALWGRNFAQRNKETKAKGGGQ